VPLRNLFYYEHFRPIRTSLRKTGSYVQETGNGLLQLLCALTIGAHKKDDDDAGEGIFFLLYGAYCTQQHAYVCSCARGSKEPMHIHMPAGVHFFPGPRPYPREKGVCEIIFLRPPKKRQMFLKRRKIFSLSQPLCVDLGQLVEQNLKSHLIYFLITFHSCGATAMPIPFIANYKYLLAITNQRSAYFMSHAYV
jgi:hypothetical protein